MIARQRDHGGEMRAGGIADHADAVGIELELARFGPHELHRRFHVIDRGRIDAGFAQPIVDREQRVAVPREIRAPMLVERPGADLPAAAMNRHQNRRLVAAVGPVKIADEFRAVVLGEDYSRFHHSLCSLFAVQTPVDANAPNSRRP